MKPFTANFEVIVKRFYLMMAIILLAGFTGVWALGLLGLPLFLTAILGVKKEETAAVEDVGSKQLKMINQPFREVA